MRTWSPGPPFPISQCDKNHYLPGMRTWAKPPPSVDCKRLITIKGQGNKQRRERSVVMDISFPHLTPWELRLRREESLTAYMVDTHTVLIPLGNNGNKLKQN